MTSVYVVDVTGSTFEREVLQSTLPVVVDFWASWCQPCIYFGSIYATIAERYHSRIKFTKLNVDENPEIADRQEIDVIPTTKLLYKGIPRAVHFGAMDKNVFDKFLRDKYRELLNEELNSTQ